MVAWQAGICLVGWLIENTKIFTLSGCGKTTVGAAVAEKLSLPFYDADDYHSQKNKEKMRSGPKKYILYQGYYIKDERCGFK